MANELILIIEDNEKNRKLVRDVLQVKGYKTIEAETAEAGLKLALEQSPALILMDIQLPGMDGITALKRLKAEAKTKSIPVIAVTASAMSYKGRRCWLKVLTATDQAHQRKGFPRRSAASAR